MISEDSGVLDLDQNVAACVCDKDKQTALRKPKDGMSITGMRIDLRRAIPPRAYLMV